MPSIPNTWKEVVEDFSPGVASFEPDSSVATMVYDIPFADIMFSGTALGTILGYSYKNGASLKRELPLQHPYYSDMWATKIAKIQPHAWGTRDSNGNLISTRTGNPANDSSFKFPSRYNNGSLAVFNNARVTIQYEAHDYLLMDDATLASTYNGDESYRFVSTHYNPNGKFITSNKGGYLWQETGAGGTPKIGRAAFSSIQRLELTGDITLVWHQVPASGLFTQVGNIWTTPDKINSVIGTINNNTWHGYPAGTLLCLPPTFTSHTYPISPLALGIPNNTIPLYYDVAFHFKWYDPAIDPINNTRGHNTVPYQPNGYNYLVATKNGTRKLYQTSDFNTLFQMN